MTTPYVDPQSVHNPTTGTAPPAMWGDTVRDGLEFLARTPGVVAVRNSLQAIDTNTLWPVLFNSGDLRDTDGYHSTVTNTNIVTIPAGLGGFYRIHGQVLWAGNAAGYRLLRLRANGSAIIDENVAAAVNPGATQSVTREVYLDAGAYLELLVFQNSGDWLDLNGPAFPGAVRLEARLVALA